MRDLLILLAKEPQAYDVKTRLINKNIISANDAEKIYTELLLNLTNQLLINNFDFTLCVHLKNFLYFNNSIFYSVPKIYHQNDSDLGKIMEYAFNKSFEQKINKVVISVTDVIYPNVNTIHHAFALLDSKDVVIGESNDGGFYLIGLKKSLSIFSNIEWSTSRVFGQIIKNIEKNELTFISLPDIPEIDMIDDLKRIYEIYKYDKTFQKNYAFTWMKVLETMKL